MLSASTISSQKPSKNKEKKMLDHIVIVDKQLVPEAILVWQVQKPDLAQNAIHQIQLGSKTEGQLILV
jgi:hypothetical protein